MSPEDELSRPVAYDPEGRPLYYHPEPTTSADNKSSKTPEVHDESLAKRRSHITSQPDGIEGQNFHPKIRAQYANEPQVVHAGRPLEPVQFSISPELAKKHRDSLRRYPGLNLSQGEFVILDIKRHPIGMIIPISITALLALTILTFTAIYPDIASRGLVDYLPSPIIVFMVGVVMTIATVVGGAVVLWVYLRNHFYMTNESVIQEVQESIFSYVEQSVSLGSIEDASFRQSGILPIMFNYGTIRLSTEGDETTYIFRYVSNPKRQISTLTKAIESFKNGRPIDDDIS